MGKELEGIHITIDYLALNNLNNGSTFLETKPFFYLY